MINLWIKLQVMNTNLCEEASPRYAMEAMEFDLEKLVSKEEHLFSTCTQKVKYRISTQETLEKDQGIDMREKILLLL